MSAGNCSGNVRIHMQDYKSRHEEDTLVNTHTDTQTHATHRETQTASDWLYS